MVGLNDETQIKISGRTFGIVVSAVIAYAVGVSVAFAQSGAASDHPSSAAEREKAAEREAAVEDAIAVIPWVHYEHVFINADKIFITAGGNAGSATKIDSDVLGLESDDTFKAGIDLEYGDHSLRFTYEPQSFDGSDRSDAPYTFHGVNFPANTRTKSTVDLDFATAGYQYRILHETDYDVKIGAEAFLWIFDAKVRAPDLGLSTSRGFTHVLPALTVSGQWRFAENWHVGTDIAGGWIGSNRSIVDLQVYFGVRLWNRVDLDLGYRFWNLSFRETSNEGDLTGQGPMLSVSIRF